MNLTSATFKMRVDAVERFLAYRELPQALVERVGDYYDHLWAETKGFNETDIVRDLPSSIAVDLSLHLYRDLIKKVPFFAESEEGFVKALVHRLVPCIFPAMEWVVRKNEIGTEMFFIQRGLCEVVQAESLHRLFLLEEGGYFGEISLLLAERRTASVRTITVCDIQGLSKVHLEDLLSYYPYEKAKIKAAAEKRWQHKKDTELAVLQKVVKQITDASQKKKFAKLLKEGACCVERMMWYYVVGASFFD
jgi:voltage-gated potassium channel